MIASTLSDVASIIGAVAILVVAVTGWSVRKKVGSLTADLHGVKLTTDAVNRAVNNVPHGEPSLLDRVAGLHSKVDSFMAETDEWRADVDGWRSEVTEMLTNPPPRPHRKAAA